MANTEPFVIGSYKINRGEKKDIRLKISELYTAAPVFIPVICFNGINQGPVLFITAAIHGNELNGIEITRQLGTKIDPLKLSGVLILVPIANPISFIMRSRDLPDGRDLNRSFPGKSHGSIASQIAHEIFTNVVSKCHYGIDLHTAGHGRANLSHVRADLQRQSIRNLASYFGTEVVIDSTPEGGTLRYAAMKKGIPVITFESGQPMTFEKTTIQKGLNGVKNVMNKLGMYNFSTNTIATQLIVENHKWIRAKHGGILILNVKPGDIVKKGQVIGYTTKPFGNNVSNIVAPFSGIVISTTTIPTTIPGGAICHLSKLDQTKYKILKKIKLS